MKAARNRMISLCGLATAATVALGSAAQAVESPEDLTTATATATASAAQSAEAGVLLPTVVAPRVDATRAAVAVTSGYDGARASATLVTAADVHLWGPMAVRVGFTYMPDGGQQSFQPHFGLRFQLLRQAHHGVDGGLGAFYRMERFTQDEGLVQVMGTLGRRFDRVGLFGNVAYGQDPEGDDRDGDLKLAALYTVSSYLQLGVDGRARIDLFSDDTRRAARGDTNFDFAVGPLACLTFGRFAVLGQVGMSGAKAVQWRSGLLATMGAAGVF